MLTGSPSMTVKVTVFLFSRAEETPPVITDNKAVIMKILRTVQRGDRISFTVTERSMMPVLGSYPDMPEILRDRHTQK